MALIHLGLFDAHTLESKLLLLITFLGVTGLGYITYMLKFHPLSKFPGPLFSSISSLYLAIIAVRRHEPEYIVQLMRKYGSELHCVLIIETFY